MSGLCALRHETVIPEGSDEWATNQCSVDLSSIVSQVLEPSLMYKLSGTFVQICPTAAVCP